MKKILLLLIYVLLLATLSTNAFASNTYDLPKLNLSLDSPDDWIVITRNPDDNEEAENLFGTDSTTIINFLEQREIHINFSKNDSSEEIFITMFDDEGSKDVVSLNSLSDKQLEKFADTIMNTSYEDVKDMVAEQSYDGIVAEGVDWLKYEIYDHKQATFVKFYLNKIILGIEYPSIQYTTIQNGQTISITVISYTGELSESLESVSKEVIDSITFTKLAERKAGIDYNEAMKSGLVTGCLCAAAAGLFYLINGKNKNNNKYTSSFPNKKL